MSDILYVRALEVEAVIGVFAWEREVRQTIRLDLEVRTDIRKAAATDDIAQALNYKALCKRVISYVGESRFVLVESLAESLAQLILDEFAAPWVRLRISKPGAVRGTEDVGLCIERSLRG